MVSMYAVHKEGFWIAAIIVPVLLCLLHYRFFRPRRIERIGCISAALVIGHAYLSVLANPESARILWDGRVSRRYAEEHHPEWEYRD